MPVAGGLVALAIALGLGLGGLAGIAAAAVVFAEEPDDSRILELAAPAALTADEALALAARLDRAHAVTREPAEQDALGTEVAGWTVDRWLQGSHDPAGDVLTVAVFWEEWCPHCKKQLPVMQGLSERWGPLGVRVVGFTGITKTSTEAAARVALRDAGVTFPIGVEKDRAMSQRYGVSAIPAAMLVKSGRVVWRGHPADLDDAMLSDASGLPAPPGGPATFPNLATLTMLTLPSGLQLHDARTGSGAAARGDTVAVEYTLWGTDGTQLDTSTGRGPLEFELGGGSMIRGFDEGITGMGLGAERVLVVPPSLGYGASPPGRIPANATLVFHVRRVR